MAPEPTEPGPRQVGRPAYLVPLVVAAGLFIAAAFPAAGQQVSAPFTQRQCEDAKSIIISLLTKYRGRISSELAQSFGAFATSNCDLGTNFVRTNATDEQAFGELRVRLVALRTADAGPALTR